MKIIIIILFLFLSLFTNASISLFLVSPLLMKNNVAKYDSYFSKAYHGIRVIYTGENISRFEVDYKSLVDRLNFGDTVIMVWIGHTGLTIDPDYRGGACFILSNKVGKDINQATEIIGFDAIRIMVNWLTDYYGFRIVLIMDTCYAGVLVNGFTTKGTVLLSVGARQENLYLSDKKACWFSILLLDHITKTKKSNQIIDHINKTYKNKSFYEKVKLPSYRKKQAIEYYPFTATHLGTVFNFK